LSTIHNASIWGAVSRLSTFEGNMGSDNSTPSARIFMYCALTSDFYHRVTVGQPYLLVQNFRWFSGMTDR